METLYELYLSDMEFKQQVEAVEQRPIHPTIGERSSRRWVAPAYALAAFVSAVAVLVLAVAAMAA